MSSVPVHDNHLVTLEEAKWPDEVVSEIVELYKAVGIEKPLKQKLVEPTAFCFGGRNNNDLRDFSKVNWSLALDYFRFEIAMLFGSEDDVAKAREWMWARHETLVRHYEVYDYASK